MNADEPAPVKVVELLLTTEIYNRSEKLTETDLPHKLAKHYSDSPEAEVVSRPIRITAEDLEKLLGEDNIGAALKDLPFVGVENTGGRIELTDLQAGARWFANQQASFDLIRSNPVLAFFYQKYDPDVSYVEVKAGFLSRSHNRLGIQARINDLCADEKEADDLLKLASIKLPEEVRNRLDDLVLTDTQREEIAKAGKALEHRQYLKDVGLYEIGKTLFVGPPGTGKTSAARALSTWFGLPLVEVRLSMLISHYLGETSKNIDRVFMLAKKLNPCILFIDEFDFVAKTRSLDDHGAIKRAVNTLLKAIDDVSLVEDGVLLVAATNFPQLLDHAAWRRFDKVLSFSVPDEEMRLGILEKILAPMDVEADLGELARLTHAYTGSDLRLVVREAVLSALLYDRKKLLRSDLLRAIEEFERRARAGGQASEDAIG